MRKYLGIILVVLITISVFSSSYIASAEDNKLIKFKDNNLEIALSNYYGWKEAFTEEKACELSFTKNMNYLRFDSNNISSLEGLQYFKYLTGVDLSGNTLNDLSILPELKDLNQIVISYNTIKGKEFENILNSMGSISKLDSVYFRNNDISNISFLDNIGDIKKIWNICMDDNRIKDISILEKASSLYWLDLSSNWITDISPLNKSTKIEWLDLSDNRITDVSPLKSLKNITYWLGLEDNCILDYKPIKPILDKLYEDLGWKGIISRYDYYTNPVNIGVNGKTIKFPYLTAYYKYQAYVEAIPLLKSLGGSAIYDIKTGTLTCKYEDNVLVIKDFSKYYTLNGDKMRMKYPMRRMQYNLAYVPVKEICKSLGLIYSVTKKRKICVSEEKYLYAPEYIEICR